MPITFEPQYLQDVLRKEEALIASIAHSISADPQTDIPADAPAASAESVQQEVRKTVDWLADRMSVGFTW